MRDERGRADKCDEGRRHALDGVCSVEVALAYAGERCDERADAALRIDECLEGVQRSAALELDRANLDDGVLLGVKPCSF